jgi:hypothetical protein
MRLDNHSVNNGGDTRLRGLRLPCIFSRGGRHLVDVLLDVMKVIVKGFILDHVDLRGFEYDPLWVLPHLLWV